MISPLEARRGCCSHHGGVCGCSCCDGSFLSATCLPYYPSCNNLSSFGNNDYYNHQKNNYILKCPNHSTYFNKYNGCICNQGYKPSKDYKKCIKENK